MVVAVRRTDRRPRLAAVLRLVEADVDDIRRVLVFGIGVNARVVPGALAQIGVAAGLRPGLDRVTVESMDSNDTEPSQELTNADL